MQRVIRKTHDAELVLSGVQFAETPGLALEHPLLVASIRRQRVKRNMEGLDWGSCCASTEERRRRCAVKVEERGGESGRGGEDLVDEAGNEEEEGEDDGEDPRRRGCW